MATNGTYEKQTKDMIDFPEYTLTFLGMIMEKLKFYGLIAGIPPKTGVTVPGVLILPIRSRRFAYCYDGIKLISKTLKRRGFDCNMKSYKVEELEDKTKAYMYEFSIKKLDK